MVVNCCLMFVVKSGKAGVRTYLGPAKLGVVDDALSEYV